MTKSEIFKNTIQGWLNKDLEQFLSVLSDEIVYTESYGPKYVGKQACADWFQDWNKGNQVLDWTVKSENFDGNRGFFRWTFHYIYNAVEDKFDGISVVDFDENDRIKSISEYAMYVEKVREINK